MTKNMQDIAILETPLTLKARGSFFVGGEIVEQTYVELGSRRPADRVTVDQMYVEYMIPHNENEMPVVMIHGAGQSGHSFDTTPDGRMGWYEYFVRHSHPVYVIDQVGRARSGFNQAIFNNVKAGLIDPGEQPAIIRMGDQFAAWVNFRIGPAPEEAYPDTQYPLDSVDELSRQSIPDLTGLLCSPDVNYRGLTTLATKAGGAVLLGHSQSGAFPLEVTLLDPAAVRAMVIVEPGSCGAGKYTDGEIAKLAKRPVLIVFGDHLATPTYLPGPGWEERLDECRRLIGRLKGAGGRADLIHLPEVGILGNSHMMMQDKNNLQVADLILDWIDSLDSR